MKKVLLIAFVLVLLLTFNACGNNSGDLAETRDNRTIDSGGVKNPPDEISGGDNIEKIVYFRGDIAKRSGEDYTYDTVISLNRDDGTFILDFNTLSGFDTITGAFTEPKTELFIVTVSGDAGNAQFSIGKMSDGTYGIYGSEAYYYFLEDDGDMLKIAKEQYDEITKFHADWNANNNKNLNRESIYAQSDKLTSANLGFTEKDTIRYLNYGQEKITLEYVAGYETMYDNTLKVNGTTLDIKFCTLIEAQIIDDTIIILTAGTDILSTRLYAFNMDGKKLLEIHALDNNGMYVTASQHYYSSIEIYGDGEILIRGSRVCDGPSLRCGDGTDIELMDSNGNWTTTVPDDEIARADYKMQYLGGGKFGDITKSETTMTYLQLKESITKDIYENMAFDLYIKFLYAINDSSDENDEILKNIMEPEYYNAYIKYKNGDTLDEFYSYKISQISFFAGCLIKIDEIQFSHMDYLHFTHENGLMEVVLRGGVTVLKESNKDGVPGIYENQFRVVADFIYSENKLLLEGFGHEQ